MNKFRFLAFLPVFVILPLMIVNCREARILCHFNLYNIYHPSSDTIYQIDTVYQYVIVYDTIFYYDSPPAADTLAILDTIIENNDSTVVIKNRLTLKLKQKKTVYYNQDLKFIENPTREFDEQPESNNNESSAPFNSPLHSVSGEKKRNKSTLEVNKKQETDIRLEPFTYYVKDTVFFFDTIITHEMVFDTVFFKNSEGNADTTISRYTEFEKSGKLVMAIETVKYTVNRRESVFVEKNSKSIYKPHNSLPNRNQSKKSTRAYASVSHPGSYRWRKESKYASREFSEKDIDYTTLLLGGVSVFEPSIQFSPEDEDSDNYTDCLNENTESSVSWGGSFTYSYFQNRSGFETGLGFSKHNFLFNHFYEETDIDTSYYWEYFQKEVYDFDTTWYLNIDTLLQTGDTLLIPNVDSTLIQVTDSIQKEDYDTAFMNKSGKYNYSYSYFEIPLTARFLLFDGKLSAHLVAGVIPSFLVSKSGKMPLNETGNMVDASEITYDYGFSLSGYGAVTFLYRFYGDYSLFVEPYIRRNLFTTLKNDQFLVKNNSWGIRFGLSYTLFTTKNRKFR